MNSSKNKIIALWLRVKRTLYFWQKENSSQENIDRRLIYSLAPRKIPTGRQLKHLPKFLNPRENLVLKICSLLIIVSLSYLGVTFVNKHLKYSPKPGGEYIEGVVGYPQTINPLYAANRDIDSDLARLVYSSLFAYGPDGRLANDLAESHVVSPDGREYTIKIKNNVRWHNGDSLGADDIVFTFNLIQNSDFRSPLRSAFAGVQVTAIDPQTVKFILSEPYSPFLDLLTFGILSKNIWGEVAPASASLNDLNLKPIGSGPYQFKSFIRNTDGDLKEYRLIRNENYYSAKPYIPSLVFKFFPDYTQAIKALNDNQVDGLSYLPFGSRAEVLAKNSLNFHELAQPEVVAIFFNKDKNKALSDKATRIALAQAIDKGQLVDDLFQGAYQRLDGPIIPQSWAYNNQLKVYDYSPDEASSFLAKKGLALSLTVVDAGEDAVLAQKIKEFWERAGVQVNLKIISSEEAPTVVRNRDFEAIIYGEATGGDPDVYAFWHSSQTSSSGLNLAGYSNPEVDKLLADGRVTQDQSQRLANYQKFQAMIIGDLPVVWLYSPSHTYIQSKKVKGFSGTVAVQPADRFASLSSWYISTHKKIAW